MKIVNENSFILDVLQRYEYDSVIQIQNTERLQKI